MKELYVAVSGAVAREKHLALIANNLANLNSAGFKKDSAVFEVRPPEVDYLAIEESFDPALNLPEARQRIEGDRNYVRMAGSFTDFQTGPLKATSRGLDMAIENSGPGEGAAFFVVETPQGDRYTRAGIFFLNEKKELVNGDGLRVKSDRGRAITLQDADISVTGAGEIRSRGRTVATLALAYFDQPKGLEKQGHSLFAEGGARARQPAAGDGVKVRQSYLEMANVNVIEEMVKMIEIQRAYTAHQKSVQTMDEASGRVINFVLNG